MLDSRTICPSLRHFQFSNSGQMTIMPSMAGESGGLATNAKDEDWGTGFNDDFDIPAGDGEAGPGSFGYFGAPPANDDFGDDWSDGQGPSKPEPGVSHIGVYDPAQAGAAHGLVVTKVDVQNQESIFDYFDTGLIKNWAGPEHWQMRRLPAVKRGTSDATAVYRSLTPAQKLIRR